MSEAMAIQAGQVEIGPGTFVPDEEEFSAVVLLVKLGLMTQRDLCDAMDIACDRQVSLDDVLIQSAFVDKDVARVALEAQAMVQQGQAAPWLAIEGMKIAIEKRLSMKKALRYFGVY